MAADPEDQHHIFADNIGGTGASSGVAVGHGASDPAHWRRYFAPTAFSRAAFTLVNNYGPTEGTVVATSGRVKPEDADGHMPSIGRAIDNTQIYILDESCNRRRRATAENSILAEQA